METVQFHITKVALFLGIKFFVHLSGAFEQTGIHKNEKCVQHRSNYLLGLCDTS